MSLKFGKMELGKMAVVSSEDFHFNNAEHYVEVLGIKYGYGVFKELGWGGMEEGQIFKILKREGEQVTIQRMEGK